MKYRIVILSLYLRKASCLPPKNVAYC